MKFEKAFMKMIKSRLIIMKIELVYKPEKDKIMISALY